MKRIRREMEEYYNRFCVDDIDFSNRIVVSGFTFPELPLLLSESPDCFRRGSWGLIPAWVDAADKAKKMREGCLNARSESVFQLPSFRNVISKKRCVIPVTGFFEWMSFAGNKYPHYIFPKDEPYFSFGGIYDEWKNPETGILLRTFSIVTTPANERMAEIHNTKKRMPLILSMNQIDAWLDPSLAVNEIEKMMRPFAVAGMQDYPISKNRLLAGDTDETVLTPVEYPELAFLK
jgi:putative SOS response-associated peptidase YedK